ncbi:MAG: EAL domain-containing protein [Bacteroidales bacterium]|nr:EAL domain-containing protein [Bacteroidales bacterium]MCM1414787.1 EAL domain-containing protein [bacterium]MCM1423207.1 EAL domain-containing protein [bacterium]
MADRRKQKSRSIFRIALGSLLAVLAAEMLLLVGTLAMSGVIQTINSNTRDILAKQVENRSNYLTASMVQSWADLKDLTESVNEKTDKMLIKGDLTMEDIDSPGGAAGLIGELCPDLIDAMYSKQVSGIFVLLNTRPPENAPQTVQGIYLRDMDPTSSASELYADILVERAPVEVVRGNYLATDTGWQPVFSAEDSVEQPFFRKPFEAALERDGLIDAATCGYWTTETYQLSGDSKQAIAYSQPLILSDGTVYGVIGVEILADYMNTLLPCSELAERERGSYVLACWKSDGSVKPVILSGETLDLETLEGMKLNFTDPSMSTVADGKNEYYGAAQRLVLYSRNAPFDADRWYLIGMGKSSDLFTFAAQIRRTLIVCFLLTMLIGLIGIFLVSYHLSHPVHLLSDEVKKAEEKGEMPSLSHTGIREIDRFADAIAHLQKEVMDSATRFTQIMRMSSLDMAGYELKEGSDKVFVTENYFPMMGADNVDVRNLTVDRFREIKMEAKKHLTGKTMEDGSTVYTMTQPDGKVRYLRSSSTQDGDMLVGLLEDVTASTLERKQVERERDSDALTKLYGRQGFRREADELFAQPQIMKQAALVMIDLDNLKTTNDRFGHNFGDLYIQTAARCFQENTPEGTICARMGGDEFVILFYGFDAQEEIRACLEKLYQAIGEVNFVLPDGFNMGLSASGGYAWYPQDADNLAMLLKYADFAMYQVKRTKKGLLREFDSGEWAQQESEDQTRIEFHQMLEAKKISYHFQPIFRAENGRVFGYEALMRADMPSLSQPQTVLQIAREEGCMAEIEKLTMFVATESYMKLLDQGLVSEEAFLFINSIANEDMTEEEEREYHERFGRIQDRVIIEVTETENMELTLIRKKSEAEGFTGIFALDDYGSGYNSELNLLSLNPRYVKVDVTIVRNVDADENKQQIVRNIVEYAHQRDMKIIAEGIETGAELHALLGLGVDLLQGFYLARPGAVPPALSEEARFLLWNHNRPSASETRT